MEDPVLRFIHPEAKGISEAKQIVRERSWIANVKISTNYVLRRQDR